MSGSDIFKDSADFPILCFDKKIDKKIDKKDRSSLFQKTIYHIWNHAFLQSGQYACDCADSGYVSINDEKTKDMKESELTKYRRKHLGYVFQMYNLIPNLNVKENIEVGAYLSDSPLDIDELLNTLGLSEHKYKLPNQLSGGQQQRTAIGRAIVKNPDILLCDEPTGALDYHTSKEILKLIEDVNKKYGNTVIMVTHNDAIQNMADKVIKLRDGEIMDNIVNKNKIQAASLEW